MSKFVIIRIKGNQYKVEPNAVIDVDKFEGKIGDKIDFKEVLLLVDGKKIKIGQPLISGIKVQGEILKHFKGEKIRVSTFKAKTGYHRVKGFRSSLTSVKILL